jgi:hypothetical protein
MKKILILFSAIGMLSLTGCNNDDDIMVDNTVIDTRNESFEIGPVTFTNSIGQYRYNLSPAIDDSDTVLIYRLTSAQGEQDSWEPVPVNYKFDDGAELDYNFAFSTTNISLFLTADFDLATEPGFALNQWFKVVILKNFDNSASRINLRDYNNVVKAFNVVETDRGNNTRN